MSDYAADDGDAPTPMELDGVKAEQPVSRPRKSRAPVTAPPAQQPNDDDSDEELQIEGEVRGSHDAAAATAAAGEDGEGEPGVEAADANEEVDDGTGAAEDEDAAKYDDEAGEAEEDPRATSERRRANDKKHELKLRKKLNLLDAVTRQSSRIESSGSSECSTTRTMLLQMHVC